MARHCLYTLLFTSALLFCGCTCPKAQDTAAPQSAADSVEESNIITLHGHLVCTYMYHFFKADAGTRESLRHQNAPEWMFEKLWDEEEEYQEHGIPDPEAYYTFRSTYLPPVRSFIRVPLADTHYEQSQPWDECCPVRVTIKFNHETGYTSFTNYAPADPDFLRNMAEEYNSTVTSGIYKGMAGTPTTPEMRGRALPVDGDWQLENPGLLTQRYIEEGKKAWEKAEAESIRVNAREQNTIPAYLIPHDGHHKTEWATSPTSEPGKERIVNITGTPYRLTATGNKLIFSEMKGGAALTQLELPLKYPGAEKAPLLICTASQNPPGSSAGTILCLAPDGKSLVIVPEYDKYQEPVYISWRDSSPCIEELVCYRSSLARSGIPTVLTFEGWLGNTPIFQHCRADGLSI